MPPLCLVFRRVEVYKAECFKENDKRGDAYVSVGERWYERASREALSRPVPHGE